MFEKVLNSSTNLVLIFDKNFSLSWTNKAYIEFKKQNNIQNLDEFIQIDIIKSDLQNSDEYEFEHCFNKMYFKVKAVRINTDFALIFNHATDNETLYALKYIDSVTQAGNRTLHVKKIEDFYKQRLSKPSLNMLMFGIDFEHFEKIDYFHSYDIGNTVLTNFVKTLKDLSAEDMVFRISGTQLILMYMYDKNDFDTDAYIKKVVDTFAKPIYIDEENSVQLMTNIGAVVLPKDGKDYQEALTNLTLAYQYSEKRHEKVSISFYKEQFGKDIMKDLQIESKLETVIENDQLELYYQPKIDLKDKKIYGFEALLRWNDPKLGQISPIDFIPVAENAGLIVKIGSWVLEKACLQSNIWLKEGKNFKLSVNVSVRQLQDPNFIKILKKIITKTKVNTSFIELEVTESILSENLEEINDLFGQIKNLGLSISLDDFGTGYSSLSYLRNLPIDILKVDRAFVKNMCTHSQDAAIAKTIVTLAKELSLKVIAEGVEEFEQIEFLENMHCDFVQGFYYYKPMCVKDVEEILKNYK